MVCRHMQRVRALVSVYPLDNFKDKNRQIQLQYIKPVIMLLCCMPYCSC